MTTKPSIIYARVSTAIQDTDRQVVDLDRSSICRRMLMATIIPLNVYSLRRSLEPRKTVSAQP